MGEKPGIDKEIWALALYKNWGKKPRHCKERVVNSH